MGSFSYVVSTMRYLAFTRHEKNVRHPSLQVLRSVLNASVNGQNPDIEIIDANVENG